MHIKAAIYCRLSEEDRNKQAADDDSESIQNQKSMLLNYAMEQGWEVYNIYSDDDYTGADRNRPEFKRLIEDAGSHKFDVVLCKTQSRFTRELELVEKYIHGLFPLWGIRFVSIVDNADTDNKGNKKSRQINGLVNEWYLEDMSENIKSVLINKRQNGFHIGAFALYGYKKDPLQKGHLIIDEEAAGVVRKVFTLFSQGYGKTAIARILNDCGIPNPTEYKRLQGLRYRQPKTPLGSLWKYSSISSMLTNEIYIGNMVQGKYGSISYKTKENKPRPKHLWYRVEGTHEPVIDKELWNKVQLLIKDRAKPMASGKIGLFSKKARCASCGYCLRSSKSHGRHYLQCPSRHVAKNACPGSFISAEKLEQAVILELRLLTAQYLDKNLLKQNINLENSLESQKIRLETSISAYEKKAGDYGRALRELYMDKVKGVVSQDDYVEISQAFNAEKERLHKAILHEQNQLAAIEKEIKDSRDINQIIDQYMNPEQLKREMVDMMIDYISIGRRIPGTSQVPIEIHWNF